MKILIIGGTSFVGRAIALAASEKGHEVTVFNRGQTPSDLPSSVTRLLGDRHSDLTALEELSFDATIDAIAYQRRDVEALHEVLGGRAGYYLQISSISAYQDPAGPGADESTPLNELGDIDPNADVTAFTYGPLKAECERAALELFGSDIGIVRPTYVIGSHDKTFRFPYWVSRIERGRRVAFPGPANSPLQWIDARDLGAFVVRLTESRFAGAVNALGTSPAKGFREVLETVAKQIGTDGVELVEITAGEKVDVSWYQKLPLWSGPQGEAMLAMSNAKALSLGLTLRSLEESVSDTHQWLRTQETPDWWLSNEEEQQLLSQA